MKFTNQMKIRSTLNDQVQSEMSSNSLQHLQLAVDASASGILHQICKIKKKLFTNPLGHSRPVDLQKCSPLPQELAMPPYLEGRLVS